MPSYRIQTGVDAEAPGSALNSIFCFMLDEAPRLVSIRGDTETLLGVGQRAFLSGKIQFKDLIHPDDDEVAGRVFSPDLESRSGVFNIRLRHADGRIRCFKGHYVKKPCRSPGRALLHLTIVDVRNLHEPGDDFLVACFKTLIEQTSDYIYVKNRNHVILSASRSVPDLTESAKSAAELVGKTDYDLHPEEIADAAYRVESQAFAEGRRVSKIQQLPSQDGTKRWIDNRKYPITGPDGGIAGVFGVAPDVTEDVESRLKLRESEALLHEAEAIAHLGSFVLDISAQVWKTSPEMDALLGIDAGRDHSLEGFWPLIHPDDRAVVEKRFKSYFLGAVPSFEGEYRIVRWNDKAVRWIRVHTKLEFDAQGKPSFLRGTIQDITEWKQADDALREGRELLRLFIDHAPAGLAMLDRDLRYLAVSQRWREIHDLNGRELIGHTHYEFFPNLPEDWKALHRQALGGEAVPPGEACMQRPDGSLQWVLREIRPWFKGDGGIGGIIIFSEDITERKATEAALREREGFLREAQQIARLGNFCSRYSCPGLEDLVRGASTTGNRCGLRPRAWGVLAADPSRRQGSAR